MADTPSATSASKDFDLSSDEEDDILRTLKQQAARGPRSSASYDPGASSDFGKTTASSEGTPNFESMRDAFRAAGSEALEAKPPTPPNVAASPISAPPTANESADESIRVDFGQAAARQSLAHQSIASVDGVMMKSRDESGLFDAVAEATHEEESPGPPSSVYSPPGAEEAKAPLTSETSVYSPPGASCEPTLASAVPTANTVNTSADEFAMLAAAQAEASSSEEEDDDDPEDRQARKYVGKALKPAKKAALERLVEQLQRDNDRLQASLQLAYQRAEEAKGTFEKEKEALLRRAKEAATEAKFALASAASPGKRRPGELAASAMDPRASRLGAELQLAKERDALRDEVGRLEALRVKDQEKMRELRRQPPTPPPPPRAPPSEERNQQNLERRCTDLEHEVEDQRAAHEHRIHALRDEFEKLRDAHDRKLRAVKAEALRKTRLKDSSVRKTAMAPTENTIVGPKKSAGISKSALHAIEEQSRKDHESKLKAEAKAEKLTRDLAEAKDQLKRARQKLKIANAGRASQESLVSMSATSSPPPPRHSRSKDQSPRPTHRDAEAASPAPPPPAKRRDAGTQSPRPHTADSGSQSPRPPKRAASPAPARRAPRTAESEDQTLVASVESVPPPPPRQHEAAAPPRQDEAAAPPPPPPVVDGEATKDQLALRALRVELNREREINRRLADERDAPEEELGVYRERAAALRDALEQATRDAEKESRLRREAEATLHAERAQKPDSDALAGEVSQLREANRDAQREVHAARETARLAAEDAARLHRSLQLRAPGTTTEVAVAALAAQVDELELRAKRRQEDIAAAVLDANASARLELARYETRAAEALAAKDAQLHRFRGELDSLLDALRAAVADKARAQAVVSEKRASDHLAFAAEAFDVSAE